MQIWTYYRTNKLYFKLLPVEQKPRTTCRKSTFLTPAVGTNIDHYAQYLMNGLSYTHRQNIHIACALCDGNTAQKCFSLTWPHTHFPPYSALRSRWVNNFTNVFRLPPPSKIAMKILGRRFFTRAELNVFWLPPPSEYPMKIFGASFKTKFH